MWREQKREEEEIWCCLLMILCPCAKWWFVGGGGCDMVQKHDIDWQQEEKWRMKTDEKMKRGHM